VGYRQESEMVQKLTRPGVIVEFVPLEGHAE
jgi:hypothetical protein